MIQMQTTLDVADNSGAKKLVCIKVLGGSKRKYATIGDIITVAIREAMPNSPPSELPRAMTKLMMLPQTPIIQKFLMAVSQK